MKKHIRKVLALAVCLIMVIGTMVPYAFAEGETPTSTLNVGDQRTFYTNDKNQLPEAPEGTEWQGPVEGQEAGVLQCDKENGQIIWGEEWESIDAKDYVENDKHYKKETTYVDKYYYKGTGPLGSGLKAGDECIPDEHGVTINEKKIPLLGITYYYWRVNNGSWFENLENFLLDKKTVPVDKYSKQKSEEHYHTDNCYTEAKTTYTWTLVKKNTPPTPEPELGSLKITKIIKGVESADKPGDCDIDFKIDEEKELTVRFENFTPTGEDKTYTATATISGLSVGEHTIEEIGTSGIYGYNEFLDEKSKEVTISKETQTPKDLIFENEYEVKKGTILVTKIFSGISELPSNFKIILERMTEDDGDDAQKPIILTKGDDPKIEKNGNSTTYTWKVEIPMKYRYIDAYRVYEENADIPGYNLTATYVVTIPKVALPNAMLAEGPESDVEIISGKGTTLENYVPVYSEYQTQTKIAFNNLYTKPGGGYEPRLHTLTLNKQVVGLDNVPAGYKVTVNITDKATGAVVKTVKLGANGTQTVFLPNGEYTLTEVSAAVDGYKQVGQTFSANDFKLNDSMSITVTNTYEKDAEEPIVDPDPTEPATPVGPTKQDDEDQAKVPKTGDNTPMSLAIYGILAAGALLGLRKTTKRETK